MQISNDKILYIAVMSIFFTIIFIPLLRYFVLNYFQGIRQDISNLYELVKELNDECKARGEKIGKIEGRLNGK